MQFETWDQAPVRAVRLTQHSTFATTTRNLSKTAVIGSHKTKNRADACSRKRRNQESALSIPEYSGRYAQIVKAKIEDQSNAHQVKFAHVFVLIFVNGLEPATMRS